MNYIQQLNSAFSRIYDDDRLTAAHCSLYMAMFQQWNLNGFPKKMFIFRNDIMRQSKIGSKSSYHSKLRELDKWEYLRYYPSKNAFKGSMIEMIIFKNSKRKFVGRSCKIGRPLLEEEQHSRNRSPVEQQNQGKRSLPERQELGESNPQTDPVKEQGNPHRGQVEVQQSLHTGQDKEQRTPQSGQVEVFDINRYKHKTKKTDKPASAEEVINYFISENGEEAEALKFLNYYTARGWKTGGENPIRNWKKVAEVWMAKSSNRTTESSKNLKTTKRKNYGQPL